MESVIRLLPDALANQIAAGEVVQRPASVVKELLENAIDAGASRIEVVLRDAGRTLVQVTDNGCGMSAQDARMCFERHATSKIRGQADLFAIRTLGFRGEALASIAAVAQVRLRTRRGGDELGTEVEVEGNAVKAAGPVVAPVGTTFSVRNLFFNVPARRNFLKSNAVEMRHVLAECVRVFLPNTSIHWTVTHNDLVLFDLPAGGLEARMCGLFGKELEHKLVRAAAQTEYAAVQGLVSRPDVQRRDKEQQFLFVNNRYIRSPYLSHAVATAYEGMLGPDMFPAFALFIDIEPEHIDINIHPTKTEVKFDEEKIVYALVREAVRTALAGAAGMFSAAVAAPGLLPAGRGGEAPAAMGGRGGGARGRMEGLGAGPDAPRIRLPQPQDWDALLRPGAGALPSAGGLGGAPAPAAALPAMALEVTPPAPWHILPLVPPYMLAARGSEWYLIHVQRAHQRIVYEELMRQAPLALGASQQLLFPHTCTFGAGDYGLVQALLPELRAVGFEVRELGPQTLAIDGLPAGLLHMDSAALIETALADLRQYDLVQLKARVRETLARHTAHHAYRRRAAHPPAAELQHVVQALFACQSPGVSPGGKPVFRHYPQEAWEL